MISGWKDIWLPMEVYPGTVSGLGEAFLQTSVVGPLPRRGRLVGVGEVEVKGRRAVVDFVDSRAELGKQVWVANWR